MALANQMDATFALLQKIYTQCQVLDCPAAFQNIAYAIGVRTGNVFSATHFAEQVAEINKKAMALGLSEASIAQFIAGGLNSAEQILAEQFNKKHTMEMVNALEEFFQKDEALDEQASEELKQHLEELSESIEEIREQAQVDYSTESAVQAQKEFDASLAALPPSLEEKEEQQKLTNEAEEFAHQTEKNEEFIGVQKLMDDHAALEAQVARSAPGSQEQQENITKLSALSNEISAHPALSKMLAQTEALGARLHAAHTNTQHTVNFKISLAQLATESYVPEEFKRLVTLLSKAQQLRMDVVKQVAQGADNSLAAFEQVGVPDINDGPPFYGTRRGTTLEKDADKNPGKVFSNSAN